MSRVLVVGGGITGLSFCHKLQQASHIKTTLIESSSRLGGWIRTDLAEGVLNERGPRSLITRKGGQTLALIEELEIDEQILLANPDATRRFIWMNGKPEVVPEGLKAFRNSPLTKGLFWSMLAEPFRKANTAEDESTYDFARRRANEKFADYFMDPMMAGVYAGDPKNLSMRSCMPHFLELEKTYGSVFKGIWKVARQQKPTPPEESTDLFKHIDKHGGIYSFEQGMETLPKALAEAIPATEVFKNTTLHSISMSASGKLHVKLIKEGKEVEEEYDNIVSTTNALDLGAVLSRSSCPQPEALAQLTELFTQIEHASLYTVNMTFSPEVKLAEGFGVLFPTKEKVDLLGITFDSQCFPSQSDNTRLTVMLGGARHPYIAQAPKAEVEFNSLRAVRELLALSAPPFNVATNLAKNAIPQYRVDHWKRCESIVKLVDNCFGPKLAVLGTSIHGVSVNDCIATGRKHAATLLEQQPQLTSSASTK